MKEEDVVDKVKELRSHIKILNEQIEGLKDTGEPTEMLALNRFIAERRLNIHELARLEGDLVSRSEKKVVHIQEDYKKMRSFLFSSLCSVCQAKLMDLLGEEGVPVAGAGV